MTKLQRYGISPSFRIKTDEGVFMLADEVEEKLDKIKTEAEQAEDGGEFILWLIEFLGDD